MSQNNGGTVVQGFNSIFISSFKEYPTITSNSIRIVKKYLNQINDLNTLKLLFGLFEMSKGDFFKNSFTIKEITEKVGITEEEVLISFDNLDVNISKNNYGIETYSLELLHLVPMLITLLIGTEYFNSIGIEKKY